jgi:hypothetical protein
MGSVELVSVNRTVAQISGDSSAVNSWELLVEGQYRKLASVHILLNLTTSRPSAGAAL